MSETLIRTCARTAVTRLRLVPLPLPLARATVVGSGVSIERPRRDRCAFTVLVLPAATLIFLVASFTSGARPRRALCTLVIAVGEPTRETDSVPSQPPTRSAGQETFTATSWTCWSSLTGAGPARSSSAVVPSVGAGGAGSALGSSGAGSGSEAGAAAGGAGTSKVSQEPSW